MVIWDSKRQDGSSYDIYLRGAGDMAFATSSIDAADFIFA